jgi:hypothetical protein
MNKFFKHLSLLILGLVTFVYVFMSVQPYFYRTFPSDYSRHSAIERGLNFINPPDVIIFGDSRAMFGLNGNVVANELNLDTNSVFNLASPRQHIYESSCYYSKVNSNVKAVIQCVGPDFFNSNEKEELSDEKCISMHLSGYQSDTLSKYFAPNSTKFFYSNSLYKQFRGIEYFNNYLFSFMRLHMDNEKFDENKRKSLTFPHIYTELRSAKYPVQKFSCKDLKYKSLPKTQLALIKKAKAYFNQKGIQYFLVIMPINPDQCATADKEIHKLVYELLPSTNTEVFDYASKFQSADFYDLIHLNKNGANRASILLAEKLKAKMNL